MNRQTLLRQKAQYEALITANLMQVNYAHKDGRLLKELVQSYQAGRAYCAAHLEVENMIQ